MSAPQTYTGYVITEEAWDPEVRRIVAGEGKWHTLQRIVHSITWEAALAEGQAFPGPVNPGNLDTHDGWRLQSCRNLRALSQPLSSRAVETWSQEGEWELIDEESWSGYP